MDIIKEVVSIMRKECVDCIEKREQEKNELPTSIDCYKCAIEGKTEQIFFCTVYKNEELKEKRIDGTKRIKK